MAFEDGPYVQVACFCDQVIEDKSGVLSLIRIIDTLWHQEAGADPPQDMPAFPFQLTLVVMLKSGKAQGRAEVKIVPELPTGEADPEVNYSIHFEGEEKGQNLIVRFAYVFRYEGLYWFKVFVYGEKITMIPLRVKYRRIVAPLPSGV